MNFFKDLTDGLNYEALNLLGAPYEPSYFDKNIFSMHFYYNLIILHKGREPRQYLTGSHSSAKQATQILPEGNGKGS